ncbi:hypothetical protein [Halostella litorea]|uniref:hypothetical protein n=1 Tax=Halostella litorea TaxID=2528831 RepID=UPI001092F695|nr:hypothetical protein [Halostella litorea]
MSGPLVCPECPDCGDRRQKFRFDTDRDVGVIRCAECEADIFIVSVLANRQVTTVMDPAAGGLPDDVVERLDAKDRLPPAAKRDEVEIDVE